MEKKFYCCEHCGNFFGVIQDSGVNPVCCGSQMTNVVPQTGGAGKAKHLPIIERNSTKVVVTVGEPPHPMDEKHYIQWICVVQNDKTQRIALEPGMAPQVSLLVDSPKDPVTVYEYCNLHGLWVSQG